MIGKELSTAMKTFVKVLVLLALLALVVFEVIGDLLL
jgi:hypothetical protein